MEACIPYDSAATMKAAHWMGPGNLALQDAPIPQVVDGSILLKVKACSICGSDIRILHDGNERVKAPAIIGHEISGEIVGIGRNVENFKEGDRLSIGADVPCGECHFCKRDLANCCPTNYAIGYQFDGGFSEYLLLDPLVVSLGPLRKFSSELSYEEAALAEPLGCCINGYEVGLMSPGKTVVIYGAGPIGLMLTMLGTVFKAEKVILIEPDEGRRAFAKKIGIPAIILDPHVEDVRARVLRETKSFGADLVFTACPVPETHASALKLLKKRGIVNFFGGLPKDSAPLLLSSNLVHYNELYITGSHGATPRHHAQALELIEQKQVSVSSLITDVFPLEQIVQAFERAESKGGMKVVVKPHTL